MFFIDFDIKVLFVEVKLLSKSTNSEYFLSEVGLVDSDFIILLFDSKLELFNGNLGC